MTSNIINQKCAMVIKRCREILLVALRNNDENLFDILDPLVSDNQCHMHSILLLDILRKCYNNVESSSFDLNLLHDDDIEILSYAVFLSKFKACITDDFDFVVREVSLDNFCNTFDSKKAEKKFVGNVKAIFNAKSVRFIKSLATDEVKCILEASAAYRLHSGRKLQLLPYYSSFFPIFIYLKANDLPILVVLQRLERESVESGQQYRLNSTEVLLFKHENGKYRLCDEPSEADKTQPTITFPSFSCISYGTSENNYVSKFQRYIDDSTFPSRKFFRNCDIIHLLMMGTVIHHLSDSFNLPEEYAKGGKAYAEALFKMNSKKVSVKQCYEVESQFDLHSSNIYEKFVGHYRLAFDCNSGNCSQYCEIVNGAVRRTEKNIFFSTVHAQLSTYKRECGKQKCVQQLSEQTYLDINKDRVAMDVLRTLGFGIQK